MKALVGTTPRYDTAAPIEYQTGGNIYIRAPDS